ncbi:MAG: hypothetical protein HZA51_15545 [Planctomycetes bacterium]|nr:hypothetical protein [Planctomycetota bacterium]
MRVLLKLAARHSSPAARDAVDRRVRLALGRFDEFIQRTEIVLTDAKGLKGNVLQCCRLTIALRSAPDVVIEITDIDATLAIHRAIDRAVRHMRESLDRRRDVRREF